MTTPLKLVRTIRGKTAREISSAAGISAEYFSRVEHGVYIPSPGIQAKIAAALNVPASVLWGLKRRTESRAREQVTVD